MRKVACCNPGGVDGCLCLGLALTWHQRCSDGCRWLHAHHLAEVWRQPYSGDRKMILGGVGIPKVQMWQAGPRRELCATSLASCLCSVLVEGRVLNHPAYQLHCHWAGQSECRWQPGGQAGLIAWLQFFPF